MLINNTKFADPKNDFVFKKLFGSEENKDLLINFINSVLPNKRVVNVEYLLPILDAETVYKKQGIVDVLCTDQNGSKYIIEMENASQKYFAERSLYNACSVYVDQLNKRDKYSILKEVICISILNFKLFPSFEEYISTHCFRNDVNNENSMKGLSFIFIELPKYNNTNEKKTPTIIDEWCRLFKFAEEFIEVPASSPICEKAYHVLEVHKWSKNELMVYQAIEKTQMDNKAREELVYDEGKLEGKLEVARNLLNQNVNKQTISTYTGLSISDINKLNT